MNPFTLPVLLNEISPRINLLHQVLQILGFQVITAEVNAHVAGVNTQMQVRAFQTKFKIAVDDRFVMDEATYDALNAELSKAGYTKTSNAFTVKGAVTNSKASIVKRQQLIGFDVDLRGAAIYRTATDVKELLANGGFEYLGETASDLKGNYEIEFFGFQFAKNERQKADIVAYAVSANGKILGRSRLVNSEDYFNQGEVRNLDILITVDEVTTEYDLLMGKLVPLLTESSVSLVDLSGSGDQVTFTAGELDEPQSHIQIAVDAEVLRTYKSGLGLSHELLYGVGRQNLALNWLALYNKTDGELKAAIVKSVEENIIKFFKEGEITAFLQLIHSSAVDFTLQFKGDKGSVSLETVLSVALPLKNQRDAFVNAYRNFKSQSPVNETIDFKKFWNEYLPKLNEFNGKPKLVADLLLTQQLSIISGNHQPLMKHLQSVVNISSVTQLVELEADQWKVIIATSGVPAFVTGGTPQEKIAVYANQVQSFIEAAYPTQKIASMVKKKQLVIQDKNVEAGINSFLAGNPDFEFSSSKISAFEDKIKTVAPVHFENVTTELKRMQRVFQVSPTPKVMGTLMEKNLNSAYTIASYPKKSFIKMYGEELGGKLLAEAVYQRAQYNFVQSSERAMKLYDVIVGVAPALAYSDSDRDEVREVMKNRLPNYSDLFGSPDICECEHCRSMYSASAYFVELLRFLWRGAKNANAESPLDLFKKRRPDLLYLPLTCENTNTIIPYIDLVNEVMEYYTIHDALDSGAAYDTGNTTASELRAKPQNSQPKAYSILKEAVYPFTLPYHQPLDAIRIYGDHLKTERYELMRAMQNDFDSPAVKAAIASEALKLSPEEYRVLTLKNFSGDEDRDELSELTPKPVRQLQQYFGFPFVDPNPNPLIPDDISAAANMEKVAGYGIADGIHEFLRRTGIKYTDLVELIKTKFINPHQGTLDYLEDLFSASTLNAPTIYAGLRQINEGAATGPYAIQLLAAVPRHIPAADFINWVKLHFDGFNSVITLYQSKSLCDLDFTYLKTVQNVYAGINASGITNNTWSKIHRFIRLWRKLGWTIHELDLMLEALGELAITGNTISKLSYTTLLNKQLKLPLNRLATLWGSIDTYGEKSLYQTLFLNKAVHKIDTAFDPDKFGNYFTGVFYVTTTTSLLIEIPSRLATKYQYDSFYGRLISYEKMTLEDQNALKGLPGVTDPFKEAVDALFELSKNLLIDHRSAIVAAFRMSEDDLNAILEIASLSELTLHNLSVIYRLTLLSKALKLTVADCCLLLKLFSPTPSTGSGLAASATDVVFQDPHATFNFYERAISVKQAGFKAGVLQYIFNGNVPAESSMGLNTEKAKQAVREMREALDAIEQNFPVNPSIPPAADILSSYLVITFKPEVVSQLMGIIETRQSFSVFTEKNLAIVIAPALVSKYNYISASGQLTALGIMSKEERTLLKEALDPVPVNENFVKAVDELYTQSRIVAAGSPSYGVLADANLDVVIPENLASKFTYTKAKGTLTCTGVMSDAEKITLKALDGVSENFQTAVDLIYKMPEDFIIKNFNGVFKIANTETPNSDLINLLNHPTQGLSEKKPEEKLQFVYNNYLPLLKQKLQEDIIVQHVASLIGLSQEATTILIKDDIKQLIDSIVLKGFSAEYHDNTTSPGPSIIKKTDPDINFDWGAGSPFPMLNFSVLWQSYISPLSSGEYTLIVNVKEADESFSLYLDDILILQKPAAAVNTSWEVTTQFNASRLYKLTVEYAETTGNAGISFYWKTATTGIEIIPSTALFPADVIENFVLATKMYHRAAKFCSSFTLTANEIKHFINYKADFDAINFKAISSIHWQRIYNYVRLRNALPQSQALLTDVFALANTAPTTVDKLVILLQLATGWEVNDINYLITYFGATPELFKNEKFFLKMLTALSFVPKTGMSLQKLTLWAKPESSFDNLNIVADLVKNAVKARYEAEDWLEIAGSLSDKIRENQKQALISYLLTKPVLTSLGIKDADGLFEYFLIDVQMGACMDTSRIVQASAAVQMFVNRCLLNLESDKRTGPEKRVAPDAIDRERWEWMKYYRVWEANKKILLYPENWLEPEWRDDRSPFFKELESELTQNDITDRNVETALRNYLTKLDTVANLDVCGMYQENYESGDLKLVHVFARTHNAPYQFFYRTYNEYRKWSAWEKVPVDIRMNEDGENSGVHLAPVVWKNRLFIFWIEFIERHQTPDANTSTFEDRLKEPVTSHAADKSWEVRLAWSEFIDKKWNPKQLTKEFITVASLDLTDPIKKLILKSDIGDDGLRVGITAKDLTTVYSVWAFFGSFILTDIQGKIETIQRDAARETVVDKIDTPAKFESYGRYTNNYQKHQSDSALQFWNSRYLRNNISHNIVLSNNILEKESAQWEPFFFQTTNRSYFVRSDFTRVWSNLTSPETSDPSLTILFIPPTPTTHSTGSSVTGIQPLGISSNSIEMSNLGNSFAGVTLDNYLANLSNSWMETVFEFHTFYHPYSAVFVSNLNRGGIGGLMESDTLLNDSNSLVYNDSGNNFERIYAPNFTGLVKRAPISDDYKAGEAYTYYKDNICFDVFGANSIYNWELFFHTPLYIATRLSKNGKFEEAMKWFHYIFDPTTDEMPLAGQNETSRYWKTLPFKTTPAQSLKQWFESIGLVANNDPSAENSVIAEWRDNPFKPFVVARNRPVAFMKNVVIKYVENLRAWGDSLFRMFTRESVNEALQLYVIANHILGPRPEFVPKRGVLKAQTYASLELRLDDLSNAIVELENIFPYSSLVPVSGASTSHGLLGIGRDFYFCIPANEKLMEHWDTIADRLFKIRHCMDIDGVERQLALFSPPIDPAMLINAAAQGISLGSILSDLSSPPPVYRFNYLIQKANEFCNEVKSLGSSLLSAIEKKDSEELGRLRSSQELAMLDLMTTIKERQVLDARVNKEALLKSRETASFRFTHYNTALLGNVIPPIPGVVTIGEDLNSHSQLPADTRIPTIATDTDVALVRSEERGVKLIDRELNELGLNNSVKDFQSSAMAADLIAGTLGLIPQFTADGKPLGVGAGAGFGGTQLSWFASSLGKAASMQAGIQSAMASQSGRMAGYIRREQDWTLQANLAAKEIIQLDKQITSAQIKEQIALKELDNHKQQIENSKQVEQFLKNKFSNQELYQWMKEQLFSVYKQSYDMAYDMAKKVEQCYRYELGNDKTSFIQYGYWDNSVQGLCAGEKLQLSLRQLEKSYLEQNKRELELTKSVSTALLNPLALQELRTTGKCLLNVPEELFDLDYQGHYFRRIKSVSLSLPCIAGPYTTVNCTLRLLKNTVRINTLPGIEDYVHNNDEGVWIDDARFRESNVPVKAIATSTGQRDSGMFELSFRDERYLPFEGAGAISQWKIELTQDADLRQFDYTTIADVILHISYTAKEDAGLFKDKAVEHLKNFFTNAAQSSTQPLTRMFSIKQEFSMEWHKFLHPIVAGSDHVLSVTLKREHFPFYTKEKNIALKELKVLIKANGASEYTLDLIANNTEAQMREGDSLADMQIKKLVVENVNVFNPMALRFNKSDGSAMDPDEISDVFVIFYYALA